MRVLSCSLLLASLAAAQTPAPPERSSIVLENPCPKLGANFGHSTCVLDFDGQGGLEVAGGAYGQGHVYVLHDVGPLGAGGGVSAFSAEGPITCGAPKASDYFGYDVAAGNLDTDPEDELIVGAPKRLVGPVLDAGVVYVYRHPGDTAPVVLRELSPEPSRFGDSVVVGDFDADGQNDIAVAAPKKEVAGLYGAGVVHVFYGPFDTFPPSLVLENPQPVVHGTFGHHLAVADVNQDGLDDLVVAAIGNSNTAGIPVAGQVYVYPGPVGAGSHLLIEDPQADPLDLPAPRFGMHVEGRDDWVVVGANRKDWLGIHDAGVGFSARGPSLSPVTLHIHPTPGVSDYMGFRCVVADLLGDAALDLTFVVMGDERELVTWDGNAPVGPPALRRHALSRSADHFGNGLVAAQLYPGGRDELVVGDGTYDLPWTGHNNNVGRIVIYRYD